MRNIMALFVRLAFISALIACGSSERYQLERDSQGQLIRLDKKTGEVKLVSDLLANAEEASPRGVPMKPAADEAAPPTSERPLLEVRLLKKRLTEQSYQHYIFFDVEYKASGLQKPARAIKGAMHLQDLFGETRMQLGWTLEQPIAPGESRVEKGVGFEYNRFMDDHQWVNATDLENMKAAFVPANIIYQDGTAEELER